MLEKNPWSFGGAIIATGFAVAGAGAIGAFDDAFFGFALLAIAGLVSYSSARVDDRTGSRRRNDKDD